MGLLLLDKELKIGVGIGLIVELLVILFNPDYSRGNLIPDMNDKAHGVPKRLLMET